MRTVQRATFARIDQRNPRHPPCEIPPLTYADVSSRSERLRRATANTGRTTGLLRLAERLGLHVETAPYQVDDAFLVPLRSGARRHLESRDTSQLLNGPADAALTRVAARTGTVVRRRTSRRRPTTL